MFISTAYSGGSSYNETEAEGVIWDLLQKAAKMHVVGWEATFALHHELNPAPHRFVLRTEAPRMYTVAAAPQAWAGHLVTP